MVGDGERKCERGDVTATGVGGVTTSLEIRAPLPKSQSSLSTANVSGEWPSKGASGGSRLPDDAFALLFFVEPLGDEFLDHGLIALVPSRREGLQAFDGVHVEAK